MTETNELLKSFEHEEYWWSKVVACPFWGGLPLKIHVDVEDWEPGPTSAQAKILDGLLNCQEDFRPNFEAALFKHYKDEIYGYATYYSPEKGQYGADEITPPIESPTEIWSLISDPEIWIKYVTEDEWDRSIRIILGFDCHWDDEHGLSLEVTDWKITSFNAE